MGSARAHDRPLNALPLAPSPSPSHHCSLAWRVERDLPLPSEHGGPLCRGSVDIPLAPDSRRQLAAVLQGEADSAPLLRFNASGPSGASSPALYPQAWLLRGDQCASSPLQLRDVFGSGGSSGAPDWSTQWVACNASLQPLPPSPDPPPPAPGPPPPGLGLPGGDAGGSGSPRRLAAVAGSGGETGSSMARWWRLDCWAVNASGDPVPPSQPEGAATPAAECDGSYAGPRLVTLLERVQGGIIGATLSRYGVAGLYTVVVLGIGERAAQAGWPGWPGGVGEVVGSRRETQSQTVD